MKIYTIKIEKELADKIAEKAKREDRSSSSVIRCALRNFFNITVESKSTKSKPEGK